VVSEPFKPGLDGIRDRILLNSSGDVAHTVLIAAVRDSDEVEAFAMELARDVADHGRRVVVVDTTFGAGNGDEEKPEASSEGAQADGEAKAGEEEETVASVPGLSDLLTGSAAFETVIQRDRFSRVHAIAAGEPVSDPLVLLASERMETVLEALRLTYDVVFLLAPAVIRHGEARLLARRAEYALLLSVAETGEAASRRAFTRLEEAGVEGIEVIRLAADGDGPTRSAA
jgi:Mrp family chromosome partitioning ATPase